MQYRKFGRSGVSLSVLGFGAMRLPVDEDEAIRTVQRAFELGVNYLDTALIYGNSELICGKALKGWRDKVYISTKNPVNDNSVDGWWERLNSSIERMQVDCIDFYQVVHSLSWETYTNFLHKGGGMEAVRKAQSQGLIKHVCFSTHDKPENIIKLIDTGEFEGLTVQYNLLDRANEEVIAHANESGLGVIVMGPVGGGRLMGPNINISEPTGNLASSAELSFRFVFTNPKVTCAISGMSEIAQVEENCAIADSNEPMTENEGKAIESKLLEIKKLADLYCTGCSYCMPCPNNVNIAAHFQFMNLHRVYGLTDQAKASYKVLSNPDHPDWGKNATECIECGVCEPKCPQNIEIIRQLKEVVEELGS